MWRCDCPERCTVLTLERDEENYYLCYYVGMEQKTVWRVYFKNLWRALTGKAYLVREVVMEPEDAQEMAEWIQEEDWNET